MTDYNWELFLVFANGLILNSSTIIDRETANRVAVSRAYYAAFHVARNYLDSAKIDCFVGRGEHDRVCNAFKNMKKGNKLHQDACHRIGNQLTTLKENRKDADYDAKKSFNDKKTEKCYRSAKQIIEEIKRLAI